MRINIEIDDDLLARAKKATGKKNTKEIVELGLQQLAQKKKPMKILKLKGKVKFEPGYNYKDMRD